MWLGTTTSCGPRPSGRRPKRVVHRIGVTLDLDARVEQLTVADRQLTAICRALARDARVIFMDEPTTALTQPRWTRSSRIVATLKQEGVALVFVSHKLDEVLRVSDRITVLRNGVVVAHGELGSSSTAAPSSTP